MMFVFFRKHLSLTLQLVVFVFGVMTISALVFGSSFFVLERLGVLSFGNTRQGSPLFPLVGVVFICVLLGTALTALFSKKALQPIRKIIDVTRRVASGDFDANVTIKGVGELEELAQSFNKMTRELKNIETLRSDFTNSFSHEFKTPIVSILGFAKLLRDGRLNEAERREYLDAIITESERLTQLSSNVLFLSKVENTEIVSEQSKFRLDEQIRRVAVLMEPRWSKKDIIIEADLDEIRFSANEDLMEQVWINLLDNAIKFSNQGGAIYLSLRRITNVIEFIIRDNGSGMNTETKERVFEKFYQGDPSRSMSGNGLGLAIVKRVVMLCGGKIDVMSEPGKGSAFIVMLPVGAVIPEVGKIGGFVA